MCGCKRGKGRRLALMVALALAGCGDDAANDARAAVAAPAIDGAAPGQPAGGQPAAAAAPAPMQGASAAVGAAAVDGGRELAHPEGLQMLLFAYRLEGRVPPIGEWAAAQQRVRSANEFERGEVLREERARLQAVYDGTAQVGRLRMNVGASFSEYDASRGGYYLNAFTPGSLFTFSARPDGSRSETVSLRIDNPGELNFWALDPAAAQELLTKNGGQRNVTLDARLRITGVSRRSDGPVLSATLLGYTIISTRYRQPAVLGELEFHDGKGG